MPELIYDEGYGAQLESVEVIGDYSVRVTFTDGVVYERDMSKWFVGPKRRPLGDPSVFAQVRVYEPSDTLLWGDPEDPLIHVHGEMLYEMCAGALS